MTQTTQSAAGDNRPVVRLTLEDSVKLALDRNLDIAVQRLNPEINDIAVASIKAAYHPALTSTLATQSTTTPANSTLAGSATAGAPGVAGRAAGKPRAPPGDSRGGGAPPPVP